MDYYMVLASYKHSIRDNLEVVDYNLSLEEATKLVINLKAIPLDEEDEDWEIDRDSRIIMLKQGELV